MTEVVGENFISLLGNPLWVYHLGDPIERDCRLERFNIALDEDDLIVNV